MKKLYYVFFLIFCISATWAETTSKPQVALSKLYHLADQNNIEVKNAASQLKIAESNLKVTTANYWPKINPEIEYLLPDDAGSQTVAGIKLKMNFTVEQLQLFGEKAAGDVEEALWELAQARLNYQTAQLKAKTGLIAAYLEVLKNQANIKNRQSFLQKIQTEKRQTEISLAEGAATKLDLLRYQAAETDAKANLYEANKNMETAIGNLEQLTGVSFSAGVEFYSIDLQENNNEEYMQKLDTLLMERVDLSKARLDIKVAEKTLAKVKNEYRPQFLLGYEKTDTVNTADSWDVLFNLTSGTAELSSSFESVTDALNDSTSTKKYEPLFSAKVSFNLFDGGTAREKISQANENLKLKREQYDNLLQKTRLDIETLLNKMAIDQNRWESQLEKEQNLAEVLRLKQLKYREGMGDLEELIEAEEDLNDAITAVENYQYAYLASRIKLWEALNLDSWVITEEDTR